MKLSVNPDLLEDEDTALPEGVYEEVQWDNRDELGDEFKSKMSARVELFRANGRVYTLPKSVDPRFAFRYLRDLRKRSDPEVAMARLFGDVLGDGIMDVLAEEELDEAQLRAVMKAVAKHTMGTLQKTLGN